MAEKKPAKKSAQRSAKSSTPIGKASKGFTDEERAAMRERAQELKAAARPGPKEENAGDDDVDVATEDAGSVHHAFALKELTAADEARIGELVKKAVS